MNISDLPDAEYTLPPKIVGRFIGSLLPHFEILVRKIEKVGGRVHVDPRIAVTLHNFGIADYAKHFKDPTVLGKLTLPGVLGLQKVKEMEAIFKGNDSSLSVSDLEKYFSEIPSLEFEDIELFSMSADEQERSVHEYEDLSEEDRATAKRQIEISWTMFMLHFSNMLAFMSYGKSFGQLMADAKNDRQALQRALAVDPSSEPFILEDSEEVQQKDRENALLKSPLRYRKFWIFMGLMESFGQNVKIIQPQELFQFIDAAGMDRWESRIEEESHLAKRVSEYLAYRETLLQ